MGSIHITGLGKAYKQYPTRWSRLVEWFLPGREPKHELKWILHDLNFQVAAGESVGLIGINGAGKSTLLKMIAGTIEPTTGSVVTHGRVAAMLELGMGFHPDFSGRQNVYMAGQLLGLSQQELDALMPEIERFAEIGTYIDEPVRVYSSGMQMRLAFSVATAKRPDILIVDEALSVGDTYFQHKSFERIRSFRKQGTTLLIVSHDKSAIQSICDRAILLDGGRLAREGAPEEIMDLYNAKIAERENRNAQQTLRADGKIETVSGTGEARVSHICLLDEHNRPVEAVDVGTRLTLQVKVVIHQPIPRLVFGYMIKDRLGQTIYGTNTHLKECPLENVQPGEEITYRCSFPANLGAGSYSIATALVSTETHLVDNYEWRDLALVFTVMNLSRPYFEGCAWLDPEVEVRRQDKISTSTKPALTTEIE